MTHERQTRIKNLHEIEHALFDVRNSCKRYFAASRYDTRTSFSRESTRASFSYEFLVRVSWALGTLDIAVCNRKSSHSYRKSHGITQRYLPPSSGDLPAFTPAEAGTWFSDTEGIQGWVDLSWHICWWTLDTCWLVENWCDWWDVTELQHQQQ